MKPRDPLLEAAAVDVAGSSAIRAATRAAALPMLDGNEIIELSIKPSLWYIAILSARMVIAMALLTTSLALAVEGRWTPLTATLAAGLLAAGVVQAAIAALHWASRLYVLTNRRVLQFSGIFAIRVDECALVRLGPPALRADRVQRWLGLGTVELRAIGAAAAPQPWEHLAEPQEVLRSIERAIRRAHSGEC